MDHEYLKQVGCTYRHLKNDEKADPLYEYEFTYIRYHIESGTKNEMRIAVTQGNVYSLINLWNGCGVGKWQYFI